MIASPYFNPSLSKSILSGAFVVLLAFGSSKLFAIDALHKTDSTLQTSAQQVDSIPFTTKDQFEPEARVVKELPRDAKTSTDSVEVIYMDHSPRLAVIYSMLVPGLGQAYNRKYWKIPLIYGGGAVIYYYFETNNDYYQRFKTAYNQLADNQAITDAEFVGMTKESLGPNRDQYRKWRDYNIIFFGLLYTANIIDAMVDAHLLFYDISDDLTLKIQPQVLPGYNFDKSQFTASAGLGIRLTFK